MRYWSKAHAFHSPSKRGIDPWGKLKRTAVNRTITSSCTALACASLWGCGNALYAIDASTAASKVEEAQQLNAARYAPYDYYMAREHLVKAGQEAAHADYDDAIDFANISAEHAQKAIEQCKLAHRGAVETRGRD